MRRYIRRAESLGHLDSFLSPSLFFRSLYSLRGLSLCFVPRARTYMYVCRESREAESQVNAGNVS